MANELTLLRTEINDFKGINSEDPIIIDFTAANKKGKGVTKLEGNQGTRKTSTMQALIYAFHGLVPDEKDFNRLINDDDKTINLTNEFLFEDGRYRVHATKTRFVLERFVEGGKGGGKWYPEAEPKSTLRQMIGPLGLDPKKLAEQEGAKQIDLFRKTYTGVQAEKLEEKERKLREAFKLAEKSRRDANGEYTRLKKALSLNPYAQEREKWDSQFKDNKPSQEQAQADFEKAQEYMQTLSSAKAAIPKIDDRIIQTNADIKILEEQLAQKKEQLQQHIERKEHGLKWIEENETNIKSKYDAAMDNFKNITELIVKYRDYRLMVTQEEEMHDYESLIQSADSTKDDLTEQLRELTKQYLPGIPGLEIKIASGFEDDEPEGIYYNGRNIGTLSESELWQLFFLIWEEMGVQLVFVENISSLGSEAVEILNNMVANGAKVFASQMNRKQSNMKITFIDEIKQ